MDASQAARFLEEWYFSPLRSARVPLLLGPMGVGKSTAVREAAVRIAARLRLPFLEYDEDAEVGSAFVFVDFRLAGVASEDLVGLPREADGSFVYRPMRWVRVLQRNPGILLLDEITNVSREDVKSMVYEIALSHRIGLHRLREDVMVVLAGNTDEHSSIAFPLPDPLKSRTVLLRISPPKVEDWIAWMDEHHNDRWDRRVGSFLLTSGRKFFATTKSEGEGFEQLPDPRGWTHLALYLGSGGKEDSEVLAGFVGEKAARKFLNYLQLGMGIEDLLREPERWRNLDENEKLMMLDELIFLGNLGYDEDFLPLLRSLAKEDPEFLSAWVLNLDNEAFKEWVSRMRQDEELSRILRRLGSIVRSR